MDENTESLPAEVDAWPLDVSKLQKGQDLPASQCEEIVGVKQTAARYPFALMGLREWIMIESAKAGTPLSVSMRAGGLHINVDAEASRYHAKLARDAERSVHRNFAHLCRTVSGNALNEHEKAEHEQRVRLLSLKIAALKGVRVGNRATAPERLGQP